jgi:glutathione synthase/RimK-type ligase-like ATP-grasp enzyme
LSSAGRQRNDAVFDGVVIVGSPIDGHVEAVASSLTGKKIKTMVVDSLSYPAGPRVSLGERLDSIKVDGVVIGRPSAVYVRDVYAHPLAVGVDVADEMSADWRRTLVAFREKSQVLFSVLARWDELGVPMYNPTAPDWRYSKPLQLALLADAGLPVPRTLWTNDPEAVRDFAAGGRVAYKPVAGGAATKELGPADMTDARLRTLDGAPVTFQEMLEGDNFRVYCLDGEVVACFRIVSSEIDYRQNEDVLEEVTLPSEVMDQCLKAAELLRLRWTGMDLRDDGKGLLKFLELNPSPMFLGFDARAGTDLLGSLVERLASHGRH